MKWIAIAAVLMAAGSASAETILCLPEAAATVVDRGGTMSGHPLETTSKFILSNESGQWSVKHHPSGAVLFGNCTTEYFCDAGDMFAGAFFREAADNRVDRRSVFTVIWLSRDDSGSLVNAAKGYCTSI